MTTWNVASTQDHGCRQSQRTLGDLFSLQRGTTYKSRLLGESGPVLLGLASIQRNGGFRTDSLRPYGGECPEKLLVHPGELYVSLKDVTQSADLLGAVAKLPSDHSPGRLTQDTVKLVPKHDDVPLDYIHWLLRTPEYRYYCRACATGTTNLGLPRDDFLAYPVPTLTRTRRLVVDLLDTLDDKINLNRRVNRTLEAMARAIFQDWFVDFGPVCAKAEGCEPYLPAELWDLFPDELDDEGNPLGWLFGPLTDLVELNPESWSSRNAPEEIEYVDLANTKWGSIDKTHRYAWQDAPSRARRILRVGDTIVGTVRPGNGSFALVGTNGLTGSTGFAVLRPRKRRHTALVFLSATAPDNIERLANLADGAAYPAVRPDVVGATQVAIPDGPTAKMFSALLTPILDRIESNKTESQGLAQTRDLVLPKLISGEVRVSQAEKENSRDCDMSSEPS